MNKVYGIGINNLKFPTKNKRSILKEYDLWTDMLKRSTEKFWKTNPSYIGTSISDNFKHYSFFYEWCQEQVGFGNKEENGRSWQLDKDLLIKGNKLYSEDTCCFVPARINTLLTNCRDYRGEYYIGVNWHKGEAKFRAQCKDGVGKQKHLGYFDAAHEAFEAYKKFKENLIKEVASFYKDRLDPRAYNALMNYSV